MVSQDSPSNSNSSILHQFIISNSIANQNELRNHHFDPYAADSIPTSPYNPHFFSPSIYAPQLTDETRLDRDRRLSDLLGPSTEVSQQAHRLSLSLGSLQSRQRSLNSSNFVPPGYIISGPPPRESCNTNDVPFAGNIFPAMNQSCSTSYGTESFAAAIGSSKYLKPAQSLLEEMVGIGGEDIDLSNQKYVEKLSRKKGSFGVSFDLKAELSNNEIMIEKRETYLNLVKLLALLEEVERRYEEYYHHMEKTVSSFEVIAGLGAGKSYTALALQAMSKHFFSLWNAISCQIRATRRKMMKDMPRISSGLSELSLSDQEVRQHSRRMSLQHLGIIQTSRQLCRPIRGLPETSVTILRAWLFEHFLHPYPNDSEKIMLASQTGLTKNQVSNWFINARVRLWKPMIEEMYKEEFAESSIESDQVLTTREGLADSAED